MTSFGHTTSLLFFFFFFFLHLVFSELSPNQRTTMNQLYGLLPNSTAQFSPPSPWNVAKDPNPCSWKGVTCASNNSSITNLSLPFFSISSSDFLVLLCQIDTLEAVDLSNNHLSSIPDGFMSGCGKITGLKQLNISRNKLSGPLPTFNGFAKLESLDLSHNSLGGSIDLQLDGLVGLKSLNLGFNQFIGSVPMNLGKSMVLEELGLSANQFEGKFPESIANYSKLTAIDLSFNYISGSIPDRFRELLNLQILILSSNNLSGGIPQFLSTIQNLSRFMASQNSFSGVIPLGITKYLKNLDLSYNNLNGSIPGDLLSQSNLQSVDLSYNSLSGSIPANMSPTLLRLRFGNNQLNGTIPSSSFGSLQTLTYLELDNNSLSGSIPPQLSLCKNLALLNLANNNLTGVLPVQLGGLSKLQELKLQANKLFGEIPIQITQLHALQKLNISWNLLNGSIPSSISSLQALTNLDLRGNNLSGSIPASIGNLNSLIELQLGNNKLSGTIPLMPQTLQIALNLSSNVFEGPIPETISKLIGLEVLDLSNNKFSGQIPDFLVKMASLTQLVLSNNMLSGVVPKFPPFVTVDVSGNKALRNATNSNSPSLSPKKRTVAVGIVVAVAVASVLAFAATFIVFERFLKQFCSVKGHWITDNSIYKSKLDFTKAMKAVSKPVNMMLKNEFCTYYRALMPCGMSYCIKKINWSCKAFQLLSPERFVQELTVLGKLSNSNIMIPLAYTLTSRSAYIVYANPQHGTLFDLLHTSYDNVLKWEERYSIAVGIARGLAFLHGCSTSTGPIVLLHLSTKSILMESLSKPLIGDFDLGKVINPSKTMGTISAVAGSVGYTPPEYAYTMRVTPSGNVYSFGIVMLELLTGRPAISEGTNLAELALTQTQSIHHDKWEEILDCRLLSDASSGVRDQMLSLLRIALGCIAVSPDERPNAESLLDMLLNVATI
ncbi:Leucine-rich repeat receptor-like tyrosine-protein kinase PXC3 [Camellia lanceoleosa]|uniref:Leucine-rich repeat receptor-like tyrosine-protein kinase PXC3 n=1 Tax=Camellia lanceoleosa TaxID=1840588 RepID=A0ACC0HPL9_9ERIC|nr:Leucine-rich repeat receptor-like tyrosine-protein kinase PXC3 [Camellia lanceoleosa]